MKFWKQKSKPSYTHDEAKQAEMLEAYTRWIKGEKLSRKQERLLKTSHEYPDFDSLKQLIDFAYYRFEETATVTPRPGAKERTARELMERIDGGASKDLLPDMEVSFSRASHPQVGNDSELASPPLAGTLIDGGQDASFTAPSIDSSCNLKLRVIEDGQMGCEYNVVFLQMIIGCGADSTIQLETNEAVSQRHALLTVEGDELYITNLASQNGTIVNGTQISEPTLLDVGCKITIGEQSIEVDEIQRDEGLLRISFKEIEGLNVGMIYCVSVKEMTVGRSSAARLRLPDSTGTLSRLHARFELKEGEVFVTDLNSTNGTYVDGVRIDTPTRIQAGSTINFGKIICEVVDVEQS